MTIYAVSGATGHLGTLTIDALIARGVPAANIVALARSEAKAANLIAQGVDVRIADYTQPDTLQAGLAGVDTLLLISGSEVGQRLAQHSAVISAAQASGVTRIVYTSILRADTSEIVLAPEHKATEETLQMSGISYTMLRNGWYIENYTEQNLTQYLAQGAIVDATAGGRISAAARSDYAEAAAVVMTTEGHDNAIYELGGTAFTMKELADVITEVSGTTVTHQDVTEAEMVTILLGAGLPQSTAEFVAALDQAAARGDLETSNEPLTRLIGHPSTALTDVVRAAL